MLPIGPLMMEHRTIERLMPALWRAAAAGRRDGRIDLRFVARALEFLRTYADRCHHGKEEDILFRALEGKPLTAGHRAILNELVEEHRAGRRKVGEIAAAAEACRRGEPMAGQAGDEGKGTAGALAVIVDGFEWLAGFYPAHIRKEDKEFFLPAMAYLSDTEKAEMVRAEHEFDRKLVQALFREKMEEAAGMAGNATWCPGCAKMTGGDA